MPRRQTSTLGENDEQIKIAEPILKPIDYGMRRPWRLALELAQMKMLLIVDVTESVTVGRSDDEETDWVEPHRINLGPFEAYEHGVSRDHAVLKLEDERVFIIDKGSTNGTLLNGEKLESDQEYPLRHGDELVLGRMDVTIRFLMDPFA